MLLCCQHDVANDPIRHVCRQSENVCLSSQMSIPLFNSFVQALQRYPLQVCSSYTHLHYPCFFLSSIYEMGVLFSQNHLVLYQSFLNRCIKCIQIIWQDYKSSVIQVQGFIYYNYNWVFLLTLGEKKLKGAKVVVKGTTPARISHIICICTRGKQIMQSSDGKHWNKPSDRECYGYYWDDCCHPYSPECVVGPP